jgi:hypothetical protein
MGIRPAITTTTIVIIMKANQKGTTTAPTARRSTCICEQMPVSELAVIMQGCRQLQSAGRAKKKAQGEDHGKESSACSIALSKSCGALAYSDPLDAYAGSVLLTTIRVPADVICSNATPLFCAGGKSLRRVAPFFLKNGS